MYLFDEQGFSFEENKKSQLPSSWGRSTALNSIDIIWSDFTLVTPKSPKEDNPDYRDNRLQHHGINDLDDNINTSIKMGVWDQIYGGMDYHDGKAEFQGHVFVIKTVTGIYVKFIVKHIFHDEMGICLEYIIMGSTID